MHPFVPLQPPHLHGAVLGRGAGVPVRIKVKAYDIDIP